MIEREIKLFNGEVAKLIDTKNKKLFKSSEYNFYFDKRSGFFARWGKTVEDDGNLALGLPEIADIEIAEICGGVPGVGPCSMCYKSNTAFQGENMSFETYKKIFEKLPKTIGQIAFGCGTLRKHPEMWDIFKYTRENDVVPNLTINGDVDEHEFDKIAEYCGACAVSVYDKELSYNAIKSLTDRGMSQVNIHFMISEQTFEKAFEIMNDIKTDSRLSKLNAIVFLSLKPKGRSVNNFTQLSQDKFKKLTDFALDNDIPMGFDSCSAHKFIRAIKDRPDAEEMKTFVEPCESTIYSVYINVRGEVFPCSFAEGEGDWKNGISIDCNDFFEDIWFSERMRKFHDKVSLCRNNSVSCSIYKI